MKHMRKTRGKNSKRLFRRTRILQHKIHSCKKTSANSSINKSAIIENFIEMLNTVKLYHWNTHSFSQHKATDELYEHLNEHVDKFVEVLLGKKGDRIDNLDSKMHLLKNRTPSEFKYQIYQFREYLINMDECLDAKRDVDLLNIRDEILGDFNQLLYLLTLNK